MAKFALFVLVVAAVVFTGAALAEIGSGTFGNGFTWALSDDGALTISGEGAMPAFSSTNAPWYSKRTSVQSVTIDSGVTSVGNYAFSGCSNLTSVSMPGVTSIGNYAFSNCTSLANLTIPQGVTSIGNNAFYYCSALTELVIPEGVTSIGGSAFYNCNHLTSVTIPQSLASSGSNAFYNCTALTQVHISSLESWVAISFTGSSSNPLHRANHLYLNGEEVTHLVIPSTVTSISAYAFYGGSAFAQVTIPDSVQAIGTEAFNACTGLTQVHISSVGAWSGIQFAASSSNPLVYAKHLYLNGEELTQVAIPDTLSQIGNYAFYNCVGLTSVSIPSSVTSIGNYAFRGCSNLASVTGGSGLTSIGPYAFASCTVLNGFSIPGSVTSIGGNAFSECRAIQTIEIPQGVTSIGANTFEYCYALSSVTIPASVTSCGTNAFLSCTALAQVRIASLESWLHISFANEYANPLRMAHHLYPGDEELTELAIPSTITAIPAYAFDGWTTLTEAAIPEGVTSIGQYAFCNCTALAEVSIPESVTGIEKYAFGSCTAITNVTYAGTTAQCAAISFGTNVFSLSDFAIHCADGDFTPPRASGTCGDSLSWTLSMDGDLIISGSGAMSNYSYSSQPWNEVKTSIKTVSLEDGVTTVGNYAFYGCSGIEEISIPGSVTSMGNYAFYNCASLSLVSYDGTMEAFGSVTVGTNNTEFNCCVIHCQDGDYIATVGSGACGTGLAWVFRADRVLTISGSGAMTNYSSSNMPWYSMRSFIRTVVIESGVESVGNYAFYNCASVQSVSIPTSVTAIGPNAFTGCTSLTDITYSGTLDAWNAVNVDANSGAAATVHCLDGDYIATIASGACGTSLTWELKADGLLTISGTGDMANYTSSSAPWNAKKTSIRSIVLEEGVTSIGNYAFYACANLASVTIPEGVTSIGNYAFNNCANLASAAIPEGVTSIGTYAFASCKALSQIAIPGTVATLSSNSFRDCTALESATFGEGVTSLGTYLFYNCTSLASVSIPASVTTIGDNTFTTATALADVYYSGSLAQWGSITNSQNNMTVLGGTTLHCADGVFACPVACGSAGENLTWRFTSEGALIITGTGEMTQFTGSPAWVSKYKYQITSAEIGEGVTSIGNYAFYQCTNLASVSLPEGLTSIGMNAFYGCSSLGGIAFPASLTGIGNYALANCTGLASVAIPGGVASIGQYAFQGCGGMTGLTICEGVAEIGNYAFQNCAGLTEVILPSTAATIGNYAFDGCAGLEAVTIPEGVATIGQYAFKGCIGLTGVTLPASAATVSDFAFYSCTGLTSAVLTEGMTALPNAVFYNCPNLTSVTIPASLTTIGRSGYSPFSGTSVANVYYGGTIYQWGEITIANNGSNLTSATLHCADGDYGYPLGMGACGENVKWILLPDGSLSVFGQGDMAYYTSSSFPWYSLRASVTQAAITSGVTGVGACAFYNCANLSSVTIADSVTKIGQSAFYGCAGLEGVSLGSGVETVGAAAFQNCTSLENIMFPLSLTGIGSSAFNGCAALSDAYYSGTIAQFASVALSSVTDQSAITLHTSDGDYSFPVASGSCGENVRWVLTGGCLIIAGQGEMASCSAYSAPWQSYKGSITDLEIGEGVTRIGANAFYSCGNMHSVSLPESLLGIDSYAFYGCNGLTSVQYAGMPSDCDLIEVAANNQPLTAMPVECLDGSTFFFPLGSGACGDNLRWKLTTEGEMIISGTGEMDVFGNGGAPWYALRSSITTLTVEEGAGTIGQNAFYNCNALTSATIPEGVRMIGAAAFQYCSALTQITLPASLQGVAPMAFNGCGSLADVYYSGTQAEWLSIGFANGNTGLDNATIHCSDSLPANLLGTGACGENLTWTLYTNGELAITGNGAMTVYAYGEAPWFSMKDSVLTISIGEGVTSVSPYAFYACGNLTSASLPTSVTSIGSYAFYDCESLTGVNFPASLAAIGERAFMLCKALDGVTLPAGLTELGDYAFSGCASLSRVSIPGSLPAIGAYVFNNCSALTSATIGEGVASIGSSAFGNCSSLRSVSIPASVLSIDRAAFASCASLTEVDYVGTGYAWASIAQGADSALNGKTIHCADIDMPVYALGESGEDLYWYLDESGQLTIAGTGPMPDFTVLQTLPWNRYSAVPVVTARIASGVTAIGDFAFYRCTELTSVSIPDTVVSIGQQAFANDENLQAVALPQNLRSLGVLAFANCSGLTSASIPASVTNIEFSPFDRCYGVAAISVSADNPAYKSVDGVLFNKSGTTLIEYPCGASGAYVIPEGVTEIAMYAFDGCTRLSAVTIPEGVTSIGTQGFCYCAGLTSISIPGSVTTIGESAFASCSGLTSIELAEGLVTIGDRAFFNCYNENLASLTIPEGVTTIGERAFENVGGLEAVTIPASMTSIGAYAFSECYLITDVYYGSSQAQWESISIAEGNDRLTFANIHYGEELIESNPADFNYYMDNGGYCISGYNGLGGGVVIPSSIEGYPVTRIDRYAFEDRSSVTSITIPASVMEVQPEAFASCADLTAIRVAAGNAAYASADGVLFTANMRTLVAFPTARAGAYAVPDGVEVIESGAFHSCHALTAVTLPSGLTTIGSVAFEWCDQLTSLDIPSSVTSIGSGAFGGCSGLTGFGVAPGNAAYQSIDGVLFSADGATLVAYPAGRQGAYAIPGDVTTISSYAFYWCQGLTSVNILEGMTWINSGAFCGCTALATIAIPDGVFRIQSAAFEECQNLTSVSLPTSVTNIQTDAFARCSLLADVNFDGTIAQWAAIEIESGNDQLLAATIHTIGVVCGDYIYLVNEDGLSCSVIGYLGEGGNITVPSQLDGYPVTAIGADAFYRCGSLTSVTIPAGVTAIGDRAFWACQNITYFSLPEGLTTIGEQAFADCDGIRTLTLPSTLNSLGMGAFVGCGELSRMIIPEGVTSIPASLFNGCWALYEVQLPTTITSIGENAFYVCSSLQNIVIPDGVTRIERRTFYGCGLRSVTIPASVTVIVDHAFHECGFLTDVYYGGAQEQWDDITIDQSCNEDLLAAELHCAGDEIAMPSIVYTLPANLTRIESEAFADLSATVGVRIPSTVTFIAEDAFARSDVVLIAAEGSYAKTWARENEVPCITE